MTARKMNLPPPRQMTLEEFRAALDDLGVTQQWFAQAIGVDIMTVSRWARARVDVPGWVSVMLYLLRRERERGPDRPETDRSETGRSETGRAESGVNLDNAGLPDDDTAGQEVSGAAGPATGVPDSAGS
jgi:transcriptional regulator with XRE-family HTH domain